MQTDEDLMVQFQAGTLTAFETLVFRHRDNLFGFINKRLRDEGASEDIIQDVFLRIYRNRHSYHHDTAKFTTWMYAIANNLFITEYRRRVKKGYKPLDDVFDIEDDTIPSDVIAHGKIQSELIHKAINSLKESSREIIILRDIQEMTYKEVSEIIGAPLGSVKSEIFRARRKLQRLLKNIR